MSYISEKTGVLYFPEDNILHRALFIDRNGFEYMIQYFFRFLDTF